MLSKKIKWTDYKGVEHDDTFHFYLNESELLKWLRGTDGDYTLDEALESMTKEGNGKEIIKTIEDMILMSYGEISLDGRRFIKTPEMAEEFKQTEAYSKLFMELALDAQKTAEFVNGILPSDLASKFKKIAEENKDVESIDELRKNINASVAENSNANTNS